MAARGLERYDFGLEHGGFLGTYHGNSHLVQNLKVLGNCQNKGERKKHVCILEEMRFLEYSGPGKGGVSRPNQGKVKAVGFRTMLGAGCGGAEHP